MFVRCLGFESCQLSRFPGRKYFTFSFSFSLALLFFVFREENPNFKPIECRSNSDFVSGLNEENPVVSAFILCYRA